MSPRRLFFDRVAVVGDVLTFTLVLRHVLKRPCRYAFLCTDLQRKIKPLGACVCV